MGVDRIKKWLFEEGEIPRIVGVVASAFVLISLIFGVMGVVWLVKHVKIV